MDTVRIPHSRGIRLAQPEEIIRIEALSNYSKIYFISGQPLTVAKALLWFQLNLPGEMFSRVHRSHLVNNTFIDQVNGTQQNIILLRNGDQICMSRRRKRLLMAG